MASTPGSQYADDSNLRARQRLWEHQRRPLRLVEWVLDLTAVEPGQRVLDVGCGNGAYLEVLQGRGVDAVGCDLSLGMLEAVPADAPLVNADAERLPLQTESFDVVLAPHMLYHVPDRPAAVRELRRVLRPGGVLVAVTNGDGHMRALRRLVEAAVRRATPGWEMRTPATQSFSLENGAEQLAVAFDSVRCVRPSGVSPVALTDAAVAADYVASVADHHQGEVARPWDDVVADVHAAVQQVIDREGVFTVAGDTGAFVCR